MKDLLIMKTSYFTREKVRNHISSVDIADNIKQKYNMMFNHDYQNTQIYFNLGLDFIVTSPNFKSIEIPKTEEMKYIFRVVVQIWGY